MQEEAFSYAEKLKKDNESLRKTLADGESMLIDQAKGRAGAELEKAKADYKEAYESGDPDKLIDAQEKLSKVHNEKFRVNEYQASTSRSTTRSTKPTKLLSFHKEI